MKQQRIIKAVITPKSITENGTLKGTKHKIEYFDDKGKKITNGGFNDRGIITMANKYAMEGYTRGAVTFLFKDINFDAKGVSQRRSHRFMQVVKDAPKVDTPKMKAGSVDPIMQMLATSDDIKPESLILSPVKWKYLVRSVLRGKNLMITGPAGCGKTLAVTTVATAMERPFFYFNLGATQDPRSTLIGNTHFNKETGTYFAESSFVKALQTENAVILLDELSRAHPEAWNILMTVLDESQRYLRIDESPNTPTVKVAHGVSFIATANIGMEYTSTRVLDRALQDRFQILEMDILTKEQQGELIKMQCPSMDEGTVNVLASIYDSVQREAMDGSKITGAISTRTLLAAAGLICDGFSVEEAADVCMYPYYSNDGGLESERTYVKQIVQKYLSDPALKNANMFDESDTAAAF